MTPTFGSAQPPADGSETTETSQTSAASGEADRGARRGGDGAGRRCMAGIVFDLAA